MSKPYWIDKTDPERYPDRYIANLWITLLAKNFGIRMHLNELSGQQFGQFKYLRIFLGDLAPCVIRWMMKPQNWNYFIGRVQMMEGKLTSYIIPHIGFLVQHREKALRIMRFELLASTDPDDLDFVQKVEKRFCKQYADLIVVLSNGDPEVRQKIEAAQTLVDMQRVFIELRT